MAEERPALPFFGIAAVVLIGVAVIIVLNRGGDEPTAMPAGSTSDADVLQPEPAPSQAPVPTGDTGGPSVDDDPNDTARDEQSQALTALDGVLSGRNLWSTVSRDPGDPAVVVIQSGSCDDQEMKQALGEVAATLRGAGFSSCRCLAKHGGLVFEVSL